MTEQVRSSKVAQKLVESLRELAHIKKGDFMDSSGCCLASKFSSSSLDTE